MSPFRAAAAAHAAAAAAVFGERLLWMPQVPADRFTTGGADPDRPAQEICGTVQRRPQVLERDGAGSKSGASVALATGRWQIGVEASLGLVFKAGDLVRRLDEPGQPTLRLGPALSIPGRVLHSADQVS